MNKNNASRTPGDVLREKMANRGWTQADLAMVLGRHVPAVSEILSGKRGITPESAKQLAIALDTDAHELMALETEYRLSQVEVDTAAIEQRSRLMAMAPVKEMEKRGWINATSDTTSLERELCKFFSVPNLDVEPSVISSLRSTITGPVNTVQKAWCARGKQLARGLSAAEYSETNLRNGIKQLRRLAAWPDSVRKVPTVLAQMGIRFVVIEPLPKTRIDGAALWLDENSPVIVMSARFDRIDNFWHVLGHELSHIRHRDADSIDVEIIGENRSAPDTLSTIELRAETEAAATWIDPAELQSFILRVGPLYSRDRINQFANKIKIHPGIIVGQLQYRGELGYQAMRDMLVKIREPLLAESLVDGWGHSIKL